MFGYIKYRLLRWLIDDICTKSGVFVHDCKNCDMNIGNTDTVQWPCAMQGVFEQAVKAWKLME